MPPLARSERAAASGSFPFHWNVTDEVTKEEL
jgi:hypothetical protein